VTPQAECAERSDRGIKLGEVGRVERADLGAEKTAIWVSANADIGGGRPRSSVTERPCACVVLSAPIWVEVNAEKLVDSGTIGSNRGANG